MARGREIRLRVDVVLKQVSHENASDQRTALQIAQAWCDQVFVESLFVQDEFHSDENALTKSWECKFDVDRIALLGDVDDSEYEAHVEPDIDMDDALVLEGGDEEVSDE